jgi:cobalt-zinc-cadmium resistance protein CzcA
MVVLIAMVTLGTSNAQAQHPTLDEAIGMALERNPGIQFATLETQRQIALKGASVDLPKTNLVLLAGQYNSIQKDDRSINISQRIPFPAVFATTNTLNKALTTAARLKEVVAVNELTFQVKQVFNQLLYLEAWKQLLHKEDSILTHLARATDIQYKTGEGTLLTKTLVETQLAEVKNQMARNAYDVQTALNHLQLLCQSNSLTGVTGTLESFAPLAHLDTADVANNPGLALGDQQVVVARQEKKVAGARIWPDLHVGYFNQSMIGFQNVNGQEQYFGSDKRFQGFEFGISLPLWAFPHTSRVKAAELSIQAAQKQQENNHLLMRQQYNQALQEVIKNKISLDYYRSTALKTATMLTRQSLAAFNNGEIDYTTLLTNSQQSLKIREGYLNALLQYNQSVVNMQYLGGNK